ncbi:hypothetical protein FPZ45_16580 [Cohnella terricola]|uniref:Uncharacterized protein n=1 Tax=Cohnella terricola TaxID=1289167 RepID=A0A559JEL6_9BACL|nr:hypothetical protein FPZ45_16580 [Cohnella terricola]
MSKNEEKLVREYGSEIEAVRAKAATEIKDIETIYSEELEAVKAQLGEIATERTQLQAKEKEWQQLRGQLESDIEHWAKQADDQRRTVVEQQEMLQEVEQQTAERLRAHETALQKAEKEKEELARQLSERDAWENEWSVSLRRLEDGLASERENRRIEEKRAEALEERLAELSDAELAAREAAKRAEQELEAALAEAAATPAYEPETSIPMEELLEQAAASERLQEELNQLKREHSTLNDEYKKLQSEYNEWIDMLEQE